MSTSASRRLKPVWKREWTSSIQAAQLPRRWSRMKQSRSTASSSKYFPRGSSRSTHSHLPKLGHSCTVRSPSKIVESTRAKLSWSKITFNNKFKRWSKKRSLSQRSSPQWSHLSVSRSNIVKAGTKSSSHENSTLISKTRSPTPAITSSFSKLKALLGVPSQRRRGTRPLVALTTKKAAKKTRRW